MTDKPTRGQPIQIHGGVYSPLQVLRSAAGWYIGRIFTDGDGCEMPGSRETEYFPTKEIAENKLISGNFTFRDCWENRSLYEDWENKL